MSDSHLRELFGTEPGRGSRFAVEAAGVYLDFSKQRITDGTVRLLVKLATEVGLRCRIEAMFDGATVNVTEGRAALHTALRAPVGTRVLVDGENVIPEVIATREKMAAFSESMRSGAWPGYTGKAIRDVVDIGIGGSDLGPRMAYTALQDYGDRTRTFRFVSNLDATQLWEATHDLDSEETLFMVCSRTFTTLETLRNARSAREWLLRKAGDPSAVERHSVAVSSNVSEVLKFGIGQDNVFEMWGWVGGSSRLIRPLGCR